MRGVRRVLSNSDGRGGAEQRVPQHRADGEPAADELFGLAPDCRVFGLATKDCGRPMTKGR